MAEDVPLQYPVNALVSFHYFAKDNIAEMAGWGLNLIGDSGAYSADSLGAPISLDAFAEWAHRWKDSLAWVASLDEIGNAKGTWDNWQRLRKMGLDVVPTVHYGCDPKELDRYVDEGVDFVGLGGMVPRKSEPERLLRWCLSMFKYARDNHPEMRFHGWGVTHPRLVQNLPWYSVDSSGFSSAYRYARLTLFDPKQGKMIPITLNGKDIFKHSELVRKVYGADPARICVSNNLTRRDLVRVAISSVQKLEEFLRKRHGYVSVPVYGINTGSEGPNVHYVSTGPFLGAVGPEGSEFTKNMGMPPRKGPNIHASVGSSKSDYAFMFDQVAGGKVHVALGFPSSQATKGLNPKDAEPTKIE